MVSVGARPSHLLRSVQPVRIACRPTCAAESPASIQGRARVSAASLRSKAVEFSLRQGLHAHSPPRQSIRCAAAEAEAESEGGMQRTLLLGALFGGWYMFNIWFNIYNKKVLKTFAYPITCTCLQFMVGTVMAALIYASGMLKKPNVTMSTVKTVLPLAVVHTLGNLMTNLSLGKVAVSFTHTIKAMEPFFSVLLSAIFLGDQPHPLVLLTLLPIVGGVAAASLSEATFNWPGFLAAMGSNVTFQSRNVLSKKFMTSDVKLDNIALFSLITALSSVVCLPVALLAEGFKFTPAAMSQMGIANPHEIIKWAVYAALCFHSYQQVSYMILQRVSPVTHSVGNCLKRVIVIVASVLVFRNPMSTQNMIGTGIALAGVFAYSQVKRLTGKKAKSS